MSEIVAEVTDLLQRLIRNGCVNDGTADSGQELRNAELLADHLRGSGAELTTYESHPGRASLLARIEGTDPAAPTLMLMGHTDVVPAAPEGWRHDPLGGELVDGVVWGRGAIDMLNLTASMAVATRRLAASGRRPRGTLLFLGVADEEAGGAYGAGWLMKHAREAMACDYVITENGGVLQPTPAGERIGITVGEKGICWCRLVVHGTPGHGSRPYGADNALVKAAEVVTRLAGFRPTAHITQAWERWVAGMGFEPQMAAALIDPARIWEAIEQLPAELAPTAHALTHLTLSPNVISGGGKTNVIPGRVDLEVDIRKVPGQSDEEVLETIDTALGSLRGDVEVEVLQCDEPTESEVDTPLWDAINRAATDVYPEATCIPSMLTGGTDARFFRSLGIPAYGMGLYSRAMTLAQYSAMFHGNDERVDQESLRLTVELYSAVTLDLLG
ncbi:MAG: M20/M25/M40 family metallo-hydrolase [Candidatus Dormibacteraeota bacterium]|uniref:M20/M25/M40 family metallo-hydrolase n=1 Tax=Candidatus Amunia macphersoniae TaxID=3127014 RepID=A0A934KLK0_9BACT|nr:M20/M25/M40 family metallo-hydrolase [Candidatus Dormibacteraeota bacterium]